MYIKNMDGVFNFLIARELLQEDNILVTTKSLDLALI